MAYQKRVPTNARSIIVEGLKTNKTLTEIGKLLGGVSRQRVYQLLTAYHIPHRSNALGFVGEFSSTEQWLWKILRVASYREGSKLSKEERREIFKSIKDSIPKTCPILGIPLIYTTVVGQRIRKDTSPSLDRIDNTLGYVLGNLQIISWRANRLKNDGTAEEHLQIGTYIKKLLDKGQRKMV